MRINLMRLVWRCFIHCLLFRYLGRADVQEMIIHIIFHPIYLLCIDQMIEQYVPEVLRDNTFWELLRTALRSTLRKYFRKKRRSCGSLLCGRKVTRVWRSNVRK